MDLEKILEEHKKWSQDSPGGKQANLQGAVLQKADLWRANLQGAVLQKADLQGADLQGADLWRANLQGAVLQKAKLLGADLRGADLQEANLQGADLRGANLQGADLRGADLDLSAWPLWCGSRAVQVDVKIARQLAAHFCALLCEDNDFQLAKGAILKFAEKSHVWKHMVEGRENNEPERITAEPGLVPGADRQGT